jgi:TRAP-type C4-dicarboxylate transport system permease small subunit
MRAIFARLTQKLARIAIVISTAGLVLMTLIIGWQVFARYVLNASPAWSESAALLLMLYYIMLAAAVGVYENFHLGLKYYASVEYFSVLCLLAFCGRWFIHQYFCARKTDACYYL